MPGSGVDVGVTDAVGDTPMVAVKVGVESSAVGVAVGVTVAQPGIAACAQAPTPSHWSTVHGS